MKISGIVRRTIQRWIIGRVGDRKSKVPKIKKNIDGINEVILFGFKYKKLNIEKSKIERYPTKDEI